MLEHDVGVGARELADLLAETAPLAGILGVLVLPELVPLGLAVDDVLDAHLVEQLRPLRRRDHSDRRAAPVHHVLGGVGADAAARSPDEHGLALRHLRAVGADDHPVAGRVAQRVAGRLLPRQVGGLGHELVRPGEGDLRQPAVVRLEPPDALVHRHHGVVVRGRVLVVDVVAVHRDLVAGLPVPHRRPDAQDHAGGVAPHHVEGLVVALAPHALLAEALEELERRQRLEDRRPHGVEVDGRRHDRDVRLVGRQLGQRDVFDVRRLARVLRLRRQAGEHLLLVGPHDRGAERLRKRQCANRLALGAFEDRGADALDLRHRARR